MTINLTPRQQVVPVILSGGIGSRLWPLSREFRPKPFIKLEDGESLIKKTFKRAATLADFGEVITVTNRDLFFSTKDEFFDVAEKVVLNTFILEPFGRNSTAAIAVAAHYVQRKYGEGSLMLVLPADHIISNLDAFSDAVNRATELASSKQLVTFGIKPDKPETGYGYIQANGNKVLCFVEKPDIKTAEEYVESGNFFWNSGIFCMSSSIFIEELDKFHPEITLKTKAAIENAKQSGASDWQQHEIQHSDYETISDISVDYAVFEKSSSVAVIPCDIGWSDVGSWNELGELFPKDQNNNHTGGDAVIEDCENCIVSADGRLVALLGLKDLIVADTADALLIAARDRAQDVRKIVSRLKAENRPEFRQFLTVDRPWGSYTVLHEADGFLLKLIEVKPGAILSLQSHQYRSEHWVVVKGEALVTNGDERLYLKLNQSTYIPIGTKHRLENQTSATILIIEVQFGMQLFEDDIVRFDDVYGRSDSVFDTVKIEKKGAMDIS